MHSHIVVGLVLPEPAVDAGGGGGEGTVGFALADFAEQVAFEIARLGLGVEFAVKFELQEASAFQE